MTWVDGHLKLDSSGIPSDAVFIVVASGIEHRFTAETFRMPTGRCQVFAEISGQRQPVLVTFTPSDSGFWERAPAGVKAEPPDPLLAMLRADLTRSKAGSKGGGSRQTSGGADDGFSLPFDGRLLALAKYRSRLQDVDEGWVSQRLDGWLGKEDSAQRRVADIVIRSVGRSPSDPADSLVDEVSAALWEVLARPPRTDGAPDA